MSKEKCSACGEPLVIVEGVTTTTRPYREVSCCEACGDIIEEDEDFDGPGSAPDYVDWECCRCGYVYSQDPADGCVPPTHCPNGTCHGQRLEKTEDARLKMEDSCSPKPIHEQEGPYGEKYPGGEHKLIPGKGCTRIQGQEFDHGCSAAFPTLPLRTPGVRQEPEDHERSKRLAKDEPQATQWYVTVFALYDGKPYTTKVVASGRSTVPGIIKVAEKQCADDHHLNDIPTLAVAAIVVGDHKNMI